MNRRTKQIRHLLPALIFLAATSTMWAQEDSSSGQMSGQTPEQTSSGAAPAATGTGEPSLENPPLSGLDTPRSEPAFGGRSYLLPGLQFTESVNSNVSGSTSNSGVSAISQGLGSLDLQRIWKRYAVGLDYLGAGNFYTGSTFAGIGHVYQEHSLAVDQRFLWRTGQFAVRDNFNYLPEGTFGFGAVGGGGAFSSALGGISGIGAGTGLGAGLAGGIPTGLYGGGAYGSIGYQPRIDNLFIVDITQEFSARTFVTLGGGYGISDYLNKSHLPFPVINSQHVTGQAGINYLIGRHDQIALVYAYQQFHFPQAAAGSVNVQVWNVRYAHRITGRLNLVLGGGPQILQIHQPPIFLFGIFKIPIPTTTVITGNGTATIGYTVSSKTHAMLLYQRYVTAGSGLLPGANTNAFRGNVSHVFGRRWTGNTGGGYAYNSALSNSSPAVGINSPAYHYWFAEAWLRRQLSEHFDAFASYQFNSFGSGSCVNSATNNSVCGQGIQRHTGSIGIDWHPRPIRLD
jgi:hypothetical protein